jgi:hypothetical protein
MDDDLGALGRVSLEGAFEIRSGNEYGSTTSGPNSAGFRFVQVARRPGETRSRALATWTARDDARVAPHVGAGIERVGNFAFVAGARRTNAIAQLGVSVWP